MTDHAANTWAGRRVLVTGGTGFLGTWAVRELLAAGADVVALVRDRVGETDFLRDRLFRTVHVVRGRVEDLARVHSLLAIRDVEAVLHFAADPDARPDRGTDTVLDAVRRFNPAVPVVLARPARPELKLAGGEPAAPVPVGVARFGEVFGGGDRRVFRVVPATAVALASGDRGRGWADGPARDFVYVRDAARACLRLAADLLAKPDPRTTDVTFRTGWQFTDREIAAAVAAVFDGRGPGLTPSPVYSNPFGWTPAAGLADALGETVAWYRDFLRTRFFGTKPRRAAA